MKLLIVTQSVDMEDPVLGFFHNWIKELSKHFESIVVICLKKGVYDLPRNVAVYSLGKEEGKGRFTYVVRFFTYIFSLRHSYDRVFVHMNQEYILLGGMLWKLLGKRIYMWRNHHAGNVLTDIAAMFCTHVFCTSRYSYTAQYPKTMLMPVGIDTNIFYPRTVERKPNTLLCIARLSPSKHIHHIIEALIRLKKRGYLLELDIYGAPLPKDVAYVDGLKQMVETEGLRVVFHGAIKNIDTPPVYSSHDICINMSSSGMYDKTIFEAMACGCLSVASNQNLVGVVDDMFVVKQDDAHDLALKIQYIVMLDINQKDVYRSELCRIVVEQHSLQFLAEKIQTIIS